MYCSIIATQLMGVNFNSSFFAYGLILVLWEIDLTKGVIESVFSHID